MSIQFSRVIASQAQGNGRTFSARAIKLGWLYLVFQPCHSHSEKPVTKMGRSSSRVCTHRSLLW